MPIDNASAPRIESGPSNAAGTEADDALMLFVHNLRYQCPDGALVNKPIECGQERNMYPSAPDTMGLLPKVEIG